MKKTILGGLLLVSGGLFTATVSADQKQVITQSSTQIPIVGTLGADNTNPEENIPEESNGWINVSVPDSTVFGTLKKDANSVVVSPKYFIQNFSGRGVKVSYTGISKTSSEIDKPGLNLKFAAENPESATLTNPTFSLIDKDILSNTSVDIATLNPVSKSGGTDGGKFIYKYTGNVEKALTETVHSTYEMTLRFAAVKK